MNTRKLLFYILAALLGLNQSVPEFIHFVSDLSLEFIDGFDEGWFGLTYLAPKLIQNHLHHVELSVT